MRVVGLGLAIGLFASVVSSSPPAFAAGRIGVDQDKNGSEILIEGHDGGSTPGSGAAKPTPTTAVPKRTGTTVPYVPVDCNNPGTKRGTQQYVYDCSVSSIPLVARPAQATPVTPPVVTPTSFARDYLRTVSLPVPKPTISAPNGGITGAKHSLNLHVATTMAYGESGTPFGDLHINATATFTVDWGDGTKDTYDNAGADWPNSRLVHSWTTIGYYDITVTATWNAAWSFGSDAGTLAGLTTTGTISHWPVSEAQAVIVQ